VFRAIVRQAVQSSGSFTMPTQCANGDGLAVTYCIGCRAQLCDRCATWEINGKEWCEPCGHRTEVETRPRLLQSGLVLVGGLAGIGALALAQVLDLKGMAVAVVAVIGIAARVFWPTTGSLPTIRRRHPSK
jgi:hypothetical protein